MNIRPILVRLAATMLLVVAASSAFPHASLVRSSPTANAIVKAAPKQVAMFFSERVRPVAGGVTVTNSAGTRVDLGDAKSDNNGRVVRTSLRPLDAGTYRVNWRVQSADSHTVQGNFTFRVGQ